MSNRTDFGLMHLESPPHCLSSPIWEEKITFLARLQSFLSCLATSFPPAHLQQEALIRVCLPPSYWHAPRCQAPSMSFAVFVFGQNWPMSSRVTAEKLTDGQTDGVHKKTYSRYYFFFFYFFTSRHYITPFLPCLLPEEHRPCIFSCTALRSFHIQLLHKPHSITFFGH